MNNGVWIPETKQQPNKFTSVRPNLLPGKEIFYGKHVLFIQTMLQWKDWVNEWGDI